MGPRSPRSAMLRALLGPGCASAQLRNGRQCDSSGPGCGVRLVVGFGSVFGPRSRGPRPRPRWGNPSGGAWPRCCWRALSAPPVRRASALSARGGPVARAAYPPRLARLAPARCWLRASVRQAPGPPCLCGPWPVSACAPPPKWHGGYRVPPSAAGPLLRPLRRLRPARAKAPRSSPAWGPSVAPHGGASVAVWPSPPAGAVGCCSVCRLWPACGGPVMISAQIGSVKGCASEGSVRRWRPMPSPLTSPGRRSER